MEVVDTFMYLESSISKDSALMLKCFHTSRRGVSHLVNWKVEFGQIVALLSELKCIYSLWFNIPAFTIWESEKHNRGI